ncbi:hypothetical protein ABZ092_19865 [Streptomyces bobili]|uniref:hypothetical protein n=1 Tax=Streptomyces bobili TaxID=67280 RepID=UPI0033BF87BD
MTGCGSRSRRRSAAATSTRCAGREQHGRRPRRERRPPGYARHPGGKVAEHVGDEWDTYWRTHTLDEHGRIVDAPDAG